MATSNAIGSVLIDIAARTAKIENDLARVNARMRSWQRQTTAAMNLVSAAGRNVVRVFATLAATTAAFVGFRAITRLTSNALESVRALDKLSMSTGATIAQVQRIQKASEFAGETSFNLAKALEAVQRAQDNLFRGSRNGARDFERLGISAREVADSLPADLFERTVVALSSIGNVSRRNAIAMSIFGKEASNLVGFFANGHDAFRRAREEIEKTGQALTRIDGIKVRIATAAVDDLSSAFKNLVTRVSIALTPAITGWAQGIRKLIESLDEQAIAEKVGKLVIEITRFLITLPEQIKLGVAQLKLSLLELSDLPVFKMFSAGAEDTEERIQHLRSEIENLREAISSVALDFEGDFWQQLSDMSADIGQLVVPIREVDSAAQRLRDDLVDVQDTIANGLTDTLADFFMTGKAGFRELAQVILKEFVAAIIRATVVTPMLRAVSSLFGFGGGWGTAIAAVAGGRAFGGSVKAGQSYYVGERGPERFIPMHDGYVSPLSASGDTYYIDARGADAAAVARLESMIKAVNGSIEHRAVAAWQDARRRNRA